jgi:hypothetical protein
VELSIKMYVAHLFVDSKITAAEGRRTKEKAVRKEVRQITRNDSKEEGENSG